MSHKVQGGVNKCSANCCWGNFNWALKCFFSFDNIFFVVLVFFLPKAALIGVPFCLLLWWFHRRPLQLDFYMERSHCATRHSNRCLRLFSFITSTQVEMAVLWCLWLCKWSTATAVQPAPPLKIYHRPSRGRAELRLEFQEAVWRLCLAACP